MRKQHKDKRRACGLCKPHKRGYENRWPVKEQARAAADRTAMRCPDAE